MIAAQEFEGDDQLALALTYTASAKWDLEARFPFVTERCDGATVWDTQGRRYVDFTSSSGAAPLGAGHQAVVAHTVAELQRTGGIAPGPISRLRVDVARRLAQLFPLAERSLFFRTGSCATTAAVRLARVHTGQRRILSSGYHGWHDWQLQYRPWMALPDRDPDAADFGYDLDLLEAALEDGQVAAVIITPEDSMFPTSFAREATRLAHDAGALMILDEVMTGFRYAIGGYHGAAGIDVDLACLSKGLANGTALSAVVGRAEVMRAADRTYTGNTFQREITPFAAAIATLDCYADGTHLQRMVAIGTRLINGLNGIFRAEGIAAWAGRHPTMFDVVFAEPNTGVSFFQSLWTRGFLMQYGGRFMPSSALRDDDVDAFLRTAAEVAAQISDSRQRDLEGSSYEYLTAAARFGRDNFGTTTETVRRWATEPTDVWSAR